MTKMTLFVKNKSMEHNYEVKTSNRFLMVATRNGRTSEAFLVVGSGVLSLVF